MNIVVIGAGLAGLTSAWSLQESGATLTVVERQPGPGLETSFANGALQHPSMAEPWNTPGIFGTLVRNLGRENAAVLLRPRALPSLIGWGLRFIRESTNERFLRHTRTTMQLGLLNLTCMRAFRDAGIDYDRQVLGSLRVLRSAEAAAAARRWAEVLAANGCPSRILDRDETLALEPALVPIAAQLVGGIFHPTDEAGDAYRFCSGLAALLQARGVRFRYATSVASIARRGGTVTAVETTSGETLQADAVVLAGGSYSPVLTKALDLPLPIRPVKGYSLTLPRVGDAAPHVPVIDTALHMAVVPVGQDRVRIAGTAEFAGYDRVIEPQRVENLRALMRQLYPTYMAALAPDAGEAWTGLRPMTPDGVPLIGGTGIPGLFVNSGHGQLGWTLCAASAQLLAELMSGRPTSVDPTPFNPRRFG